MRWLIWIAVASCSSGTTTPSKPAPDRSPRDAGTIAAAPPSQRECEALAGHAIELATNERRDDPPTTATEREQARGKLRAYVDECMTLPRERFDCALAARSLDQLTACSGGN
ncbi:MAG: hypothetical protein AB7O24_05070 [Kofleriaceae bacterium]